MGVFEVPAFAAGTEAVAQGLVDATAAGAFTIVAAVIPLPQCVTSGFPEVASRTSPPVAVPPSSSSRVRNCRA